MLHHRINMKRGGSFRRKLNPFHRSHNLLSPTPSHPLSPRLFSLSPPISQVPHLLHGRNMSGSEDSHSPSHSPSYYSNSSPQSLPHSGSLSDDQNFGILETGETGETGEAKHQDDAQKNTPRGDAPVKSNKMKVGDFVRHLKIHVPLVVAIRMRATNRKKKISKFLKKRLGRPTLYNSDDDAELDAKKIDDSRERAAKQRDGPRKRTSFM